MATSLRVLTYNLKMLPGLFGGGRADLARADAIADALLDRDDDVVGLQEVFDEDVRRRLVDRLGARFPHHIEKSGDDWFNEDSGLMLLSRRPFVAPTTFVEWSCKGPFWTSDRWADKGVQLARVALGNGLEAVVANLHLQAAYGSDSYRSVRDAQLGQLVRVLDRGLVHCHHPDALAAIVLGDFNVVGGSDEHADMLATLRSARDLWAVTHPSDPGYTSDPDQNTMVPAGRPKKRLDYILALDAIPGGGPGGTTALASVEVSSIEVVRFAARGASLSDHDAVAAQLTVRRP